MRPDRQAELPALAAATLDKASPAFRGGLGAPATVDKGPNDFATALDLELERSIAMKLAVQTGIPVLGEEFGGPDLASGTAWVLDPIDGTFNYSAGPPLCGMLPALVEAGEPIIGLCRLPLLGHRFAATATGPVLDGGKPLPSLARGRLASSMIAFGSPDGARGLVPAAAPGVHDELLDLARAGGYGGCS